MAKVIFVTLAVDDLDRSLNFYRKWLSLSEDKVRRGDDHAALEMDDNFSIVLYPRQKIADAAGTQPLPSSSEFVISRQASSAGDVDRLMAEGLAAGGSQPKPAEKEEWGVTGYVLDPEGHLWEIVWFKPD